LEAEVAIDEGSRHRLYQRLDQVLGSEEATTLMAHLPPVGWADVATKQDLRQEVQALRSEMQALRYELHADMERLFRRVIMWTSTMVLATGALAFAAGTFV
jgi:hypothetical protein